MGWPQIFDQYANRLAHLYLLCVENDVDAYLVMLYFYNDAEMDGPISVDQWRGRDRGDRNATWRSQPPFEALWRRRLRGCERIGGV